MQAVRPVAVTVLGVFAFTACAAPATPREEGWSVRVVDARTGAAIPGARIEYPDVSLLSTPRAVRAHFFLDPEDWRARITASALTDGDGRATLPRGTLALSPDWPPAAFALRIEASAGDRIGWLEVPSPTQDEQEIRLHEDETLEVVVRDPLQPAAEGERVDLVAYEPVYGDPVVLWSGTTDPDTGRVTVPSLRRLRELASAVSGGLADPAWTLTVLGADRQVTRAPGVLTAGARVELQPPACRILEVRMLDTEGRELSCEHPLLSIEVLRADRTAEEFGHSAHAARLRTRALPGCRTAVKGSAHGWCPVRVEHTIGPDAGGIDRLDLRFERRACVVRGRLEDAQGRPVPHRSIEVNVPGGGMLDDDLELTHWSDDQGRFELCIDPKFVARVDGRVEIVLGDWSVDDRGLPTYGWHSEGAASRRGTFQIDPTVATEVVDVGAVVVAARGPAR